MADRMNVTWVTLARIERDGACVSMGNYAMALYILGKAAALGMFIDRTNDPLGLDLMDKRLPTAGSAKDITDVIKKRKGNGLDFCCQI